MCATGTWSRALRGRAGAHDVEVHHQVVLLGMWQREVQLLVGQPRRLLELDVEAAHALQQLALVQVVPQRLDVPLGADAAGRVQHVGGDRLVAGVEHRADRLAGGADRLACRTDRLADVCMDAERASATACQRPRVRVSHAAIGVGGGRAHLLGLERAVFADLAGLGRHEQVVHARHLGDVHGDLAFARPGQLGQRVGMMRRHLRVELALHDEYRLADVLHGPSPDRTPGSWRTTACRPAGAVRSARRPTCPGRWRRR